MHGAGDLVSPSVRLVRELGVGGMGRVWLADHLSLRAPVVVKFLALDLLKDHENVERFAQEAHAASQLRSPHVVQVLDHGISAKGEPYIVMELLEGRDLRKVLMDRRRISVGDAALVVSHVSKALSRAHKSGVIHRDIKPENIFLCDHGDREPFVKLLDFGIAKRTDAITLNTASGMVMGTAPYMSPEQLMGSKLDHRSDLWSLAVVTYEALTGRLPFNGETIGALTMSVHDAKGRVRASQAYPALGTMLDGWFARAFSVAPSDRFGNATEMADAFAAAIGLSVPASSDLSGPNPAAAAQPAQGHVTAAAVSRSTTQIEKRRARQWKAIAAAGAIGVLIAVPIGVWAMRSAPKERRVPGSIQGVPATPSATTTITTPTPKPSAATTETEAIAPIVVPSTSATITTATITTATPKPTQAPKPKPKPTTHAPIF